MVMMVNGQWTADQGNTTGLAQYVNNQSPTQQLSTQKYTYKPIEPNFFYKPSQALQSQINNVNSRFNAPLPAGWQGFNQPRQIAPFTGLNNQISNANNLFNQQLPSSQPRTAAPLIGLLGQ